MARQPQRPKKRTQKSAPPKPGQSALRDTYVKAARKFLAADQLPEALEKLNFLSVNRKKPDPEVLYLKAVIWEKQGQFFKARSFALQSLKLFRHADALLVLARIHRSQGETDACCKVCDEVVAMNQRVHAALVTKAGALEEAGRFDDAAEVIEPMVEEAEAAGRQPSLLVLDIQAKLLVQRKKHDEALKVIDALIGDERNIEGVRRNAYHLRAKSCDRAKDFDEAWSSATKANEINEVIFDADLYTQQVDSLMEVWSRENMEKFPQADCDSEVPVFIAGMPRSGTSLIDQIIDAHPSAAGVGELASIEMFAGQLSMAYDSSKEPPACFGEYDRYQWTRIAKKYVEHIKDTAEPGVERIVNKALGNNRIVGLIARLFPKTRIIHAIRDPRDVAISCFMGGFNNQRSAWTTRVEWAARAWAESARLMEHWKTTLDVPIIDVHYEKLVADPENEFPRLIEFLGLPWDDRCFDFYKSKRTVRTLSYDQVNRPIYTTSSGRHKNYEDHIKDVEFPEYQLS